MEQKTKLFLAVRNAFLRRPIASVGILMIGVCAILNVCGFLSAESILLTWIILSFIGWVGLLFCILCHPSIDEKS